MNSNERSERRKKLNAKAEKILKVIEAEQSRTVATERKKATRRKILLGALVIELTNTGVLDRDLILNHLSMTAIMLDHKYPHKERAVQHRQPKGQPITDR